MYVAPADFYLVAASAAPSTTSEGAPRADTAQAGSD
jgi:hypothetical protein